MRWILALLLLSGAAQAEEPRAQKKIDEMNRAAMEAYDLLEFDAARKSLTDALAFARKNKLEKSPAAARTHLDLGIVAGAGLGDGDAALLEFIAALQIDPALRLDPAYRSPTLQKTLDKARATVGDAAPPPAAEDRSFKHTPVEESLAGQAILVAVRVGTDLRAAQVVLSYRPGAVEGFTQQPMKTQNGVEYQGIVPEGATRGAAVQYFVEARGANGKLLAAVGSAEAPNVVAIARPGVAEDGPATAVTKASDSGAKRFWVALSVGSGAGYVSGKTEVSFQNVTCCLAPAPFHVLPDVGYWLTPHMALSLAARLGFPIGADVAGAATLAPAVLGRFWYETGRYGGLVVHGDLGGGVIRHVVKLTATSATAAQGDTDTFATGPLFVGGGIGWNKPLG